MRKISIAKALQVKNELVSKIKSLEIRINKNNSRETTEGKPANFDYNVFDLLKELHSVKNSLISLKVTLDVASAPIREKIYSLSELKSDNKLLGLIPTNSGVESGYQNTKYYECQMTRVQVDDLIEQNKVKITEILDEINLFNNSVFVEIE